MEKNVLIVDDHSIVSLGVSLLLKQHFPFVKVLQDKSHLNVLKLLKELPIDLVILDLNFPEGNSIGLISDIKKLYPDVILLMFTSESNVLTIHKMITEGADGYLNKSSAPNKLVSAISILFKDGVYLEDIPKRESASESKLNVLSERELEVSKLLAEGMPIMDISKKLELKTSTVSTYKNRIFEKLKVSNLVQFLEVFKSYKLSYQ